MRAEVVDADLITAKLAELDDRTRRVRDRCPAEALGQAAGFRNVVAHGYAGIDLDTMHRAATTRLEDLDSFAREVATWLRRRTARPILGTDPSHRS